MRAFRWVWAGWFLWPAFAAGQVVQQAPTLATVDTVQMPAWLERDGHIQALAVGAAVRNGDKIRTGPRARVYLELAEGSGVTLGENAVLKVHSRSLRPARNFKGALDVLSGAFRLTTQAMQRPGSQRDIAIRIGTATAVPVVHGGGTDLWGSVDALRDLVLLIEGSVEVRHAGATFEMTEALSYFSAPRNAAPQPLMRADPERFKSWARETEALAGDGLARRGRKWHVLLARVDQQREALTVYDKARDAGYAAQVRVRPGGAGAPGKGGQWNYEVILTQLASEQDAVVVASKIKAQLGFDAVAAQ